jgi:hypothetical protein
VRDRIGVWEELRFVPLICIEVLSILLPGYLILA